MVIGIIGLVDKNMPDGNAQRPGDGREILFR